MSSIPAFFKESYSQTDYRVYTFTGIQRKVIYGILRRSYALFAEIIIQHLIKLSFQHQSLHVGMIKKYLGQLLHSQRVYIKFPVMHGHKYSGSQVYEYLLNEIQSGHVLDLGTIDNHAEIESQRRLISENQLETFLKVFPYQQLFYLKDRLAIVLDGEKKHLDCCMFLKITQDHQKRRCNIELVFYSKILMNKQVKSKQIRAHLQEKLKQIQDRVVIKLLL